MLHTLGTNWLQSVQHLLPILTLAALVAHFVENLIGS